jgi:hypothetical protein
VERPATAARRADRQLICAAGLIGLAASLLWAPAGALADSWAMGPLSSEPHVAGVSVKLPDGQVLLAGGGVNASVSTGGELLAAGGTSFTAAGTMIQGRLYGAATLLPGGDVLIAGGNSSATNGSPASATSELWNPAGGGSFTATGAMHVRRQSFTLTTLPDGQALAVGGSPANNNSTETATAELYNPATKRWTLTGSMPTGRQGHTATLLPNCKVLIVGDNREAVTYNYVTGKFSPAGSEGSFQRSYQTATLLPSGKVLIAGGETVTQVQLDTASVYNPATGKFTPTANKMSAAHSQGFADLLPGGQVLVGGGFSATGVSAVDIYDPATNRWSTGTSLPPMSFAFSVEAQTLDNGEVAVMGAGASPNATEIYSSMGSLPAPPANDCADLTTIRSAQASATWTITTKVGVPGAGVLSATATAPSPVSGQPAISYGSARVTASGQGTGTLTIAPSQRARTELHSGKTLHVTIKVTFQPPKGKSATTSTKLTVVGHT